MATATKQLEAIHKEITEQFTNNRFITVNPVDGDPPEKYEITYHIKGIYKDDSGEIQTRDTHTVTISIPFGFPHFPPSCKPKTPIFHPDFDPAAICIGDFWEKDQTIGNLIQHIGDMISGHHFSTSNAFNEEAVRWYKDNSASLPFDDLEAGVAEPDTGLSPLDDMSTEDITLLLEEEEDERSSAVTSVDEDLSAGLSFVPSDEEPASSDQRDRNDIDTLDDSFLQTDFDYFGKKEPDPATDELRPPTIDHADAEHTEDIDLDRVKLLVKQKRFFELNSEIDSLSTNQSFSDRTRLAEQASTALQQARELYNQGTDYEHQGDPGRACDTFRKVEKIVSDYPGLREDIERTAQARELLGDWVDPNRSDAAETSATEKVFSGEQSDEVAAEPSTKRDTRTFFEDTARQGSKLIPYALATVVLIALGLAGTSFYLNSARLGQARKALVDCQTILQQNRFSDAERECEKGLDIANEIQVFRSGARDAVIQEIETVLNSEVLHQGLAGNLLYDGRYLPKKVVKATRAFHYFVKEGDTFFANEDWQQALANFSQALEIARQEQELDPKQVFDVTNKQKIAQFNVLIRSGNEFVKHNKWVLATEDLKRALVLANELTIENKAEIIASLTGQLDEIAVATAKEQGDIAFADEQWAMAKMHYKQAYAIAMETTRPTDPLVGELKQLSAMAELYETINTGKTAFINADWDKAISNYERAIAILENNSDLLKQNNAEDNKKKLARTMLQAEVIKDKQEAARHLKEKNYRTAIDKLNLIIATVSHSEFSTDQEFTVVLKETQQAIVQAETDMLLADKITYLEEHFKELFTKHYTASPAEALVEPKVFYEKRLGSRLIFRLECMEIGRGRPLKLVMKYSHDLKTGTWQFYSDDN